MCVCVCVCVCVYVCLFTCLHVHICNMGVWERKGAEGKLEGQERWLGVGEGRGGGLRGKESWEGALTHMTVDESIYAHLYFLLGSKKFMGVKTMTYVPLHLFCSLHSGMAVRGGFIGQ